MTRARSSAPPSCLGAGVLLVAALAASPLAAQDLRGSRASMDAQERQARAHDFTYLANAAQVRRFVANGFLVPVRGNADYEIHGVSFPYARPEVQVFVERLASQYRGACGEKLVVTSLTRPQNGQPRNASARSVHPTGMAVDLRIPRNTRCRSWLEKVLVSLEASSVIEATRETRPPHYHIAVFPRPYARYVASMEGGTARTTTRVASAEAEPAAPVVDVQQYRVRRGDSLWTIARTHGTTVDRLVSENELRGKRIFAGQTLIVPVADR
jgi:LysM repeat protein